MTSRARVLTALEHHEPDRVPYNSRPCEEIRTLFRRMIPTTADDFETYFGHDIRYVGIPIPERSGPSPDHLALPAPEHIADCRARTALLQDAGHAVCNQYSCGIFEQLREWHGDAETLTLPFDDPKRLDKELERVTAWKLAYWKAYAQCGVDIVWIGDDLGAQNNLVMSPDHYRRHYRPWHSIIVREIRKMNPEVKIAFHCCGYVTSLIPDLIDECGIDILEAVQPECMDIRSLKKDFGSSLSFWGGISNQQTLASKRPDEVSRETAMTVELLSQGGGYITAPCHTLTRDIPWDNVLAFHQSLT